MSGHYHLELSFELHEAASPQLVKAFELASTKNYSKIATLTELPPDIIEALQWPHEDDKLDYMPGEARTHIAHRYLHSQNGKDFFFHTVNFRHYIREAFLFNFGYSLIAWFASVSHSSRFVGYLHNIATPDPELIYFENGAAVFWDLAENKKSRITFAELNSSS